jgi:hypothetical protein
LQQYGTRGDYDDFERTKAGETVYTFTKPPVASGPLFIGVLAVNKDGVESEGFETEAKVVVVPSSSSSQTTSSSSAVSATSSSSVGAMPVGSNPSTTANPMTISALAPVSSTGILIVFTKPLKNTDFNTGYFVLADTGGTIVPVVKVQTVGTDMLIHVKGMIGGKTYILSFLNNIPADDGTMMPSSTAPAQFIAPDAAGAVASSTPSSSAVSSSVSSSSSSMSSTYSRTSSSAMSSSSYSRNPGQVASSAGSPADASNLNIQATPRKDGTYDIAASWLATGNAQGFVLYTTLDGTNFVRSSMVGPTDTTVQYTRVRGGTNFGIKVTAQSADGRESLGVARVVTLPNSGIGILGIAGAAGALAARRTRKKKGA